MGSNTKIVGSSLLPTSCTDIPSVKTHLSHYWYTADSSQSSLLQEHRFISVHLCHNYQHSESRVSDFTKPGISCHLTSLRICIETAFLLSRFLSYSESRCFRIPGCLLPWTKEAAFSSRSPHPLFQGFLEIHKDNFLPALHLVSCSEIVPEKLSKFAIEDIIYLAPMEGEGDNVWALETSVLFLNIREEFPFTFVSVFPLERWNLSILASHTGRRLCPFYFSSLFFARYLAHFPSFSSFCLVFLLIQSFPVHPIHPKMKLDKQCGYP